MPSQVQEARCAWPRPSTSTTLWRIKSRNAGTRTWPSATTATWRSSSPVRSKSARKLSGNRVKSISRKNPSITPWRPATPRWSKNVTRKISTNPSPKLCVKHGLNRNATQPSSKRTQMNLTSLKLGARRSLGKFALRTTAEWFLAKKSVTTRILCPQFRAPTRYVTFSLKDIAGRSLLKRLENSFLFHFFISFRLITKLTPHLVIKQICRKIPKEVCHLALTPAHTVKKPITLKWCTRDRNRAGDREMTVQHNEHARFQIPQQDQPLPSYLPPPPPNRSRRPTREEYQISSQSETPAASRRIIVGLPNVKYENYQEFEGNIDLTRPTPKPDPPATAPFNTDVKNVWYVGLKPTESPKVLKKKSKSSGMLRSSPNLSLIKDPFEQVPDSYPTYFEERSSPKVAAAVRSRLNQLINKPTFRPVVRDSQATTAKATATSTLQMASPSVNKIKTPPPQILISDELSGMEEFGEFGL